MKKNYLALSMLALIGLGSCSKDGMEESLTQANRAGIESLNSSVSLDLSAGHYILRPKKSDPQSLASLRNKIKELGGVETGYISGLNMLFVSAGNADFTSRIKGDVTSIGYDLAIDGPNVKSWDAIEIDEEANAIGGDNPPVGFPTGPAFTNGRLWGLDAMDVPQAWNAGYTGNGVVVAVLDEGFYITHPDIASNLLLTKAKNFVNLEDVEVGLCATSPECNPGDVGFKISGFSHATHVTGIIAAVSNNIGSIGVAPNAKILPVKVLSDYLDGGLVSWIVQGIVYAADQGAHVINLSLGGLRVKGAGMNASLVQEGIKAYREAIQYANSKGALVVCSAGNNGINLDAPYIQEDGTVTGSVTHFPSGSSHALSISALSPFNYYINRLTDLDIPTSYTNYGNSAIDFAAPGGTLRPNVGSPDVFLNYPGSYDGIYSPSFRTPFASFYSYAQGTSMAAAHVSGVAALIIEKLGGSASPAEVKRILRQSADDLGKPGRDPYFGHGRVNAYNAVK
jgi:lantibiotic leader peptide-processing serine protease